jgi:hypothetical protein
LIWAFIQHWRHHFLPNTTLKTLSHINNLQTAFLRSLCQTASSFHFSRFCDNNFFTKHCIQPPNWGTRSLCLCPPVISPSIVHNSPGHDGGILTHLHMGKSA